MADDGRLWRSLIPGRPARLIASDPVDDPSASRLVQPGRASLEWSIVLAAVALIFPIAALGAIGFGVRARRQECPRWLAALVVAGWCGLLGSFLRLSLGFSIFP